MTSFLYSPHLKTFQSVSCLKIRIASLFFAGPPSRGMHVFCSISIVGLLDFVDRSYGCQQSRNHSKVGHPSLEELFPTRNADEPQPQLLIAWVSWNIQEIRGRFQERVPSSPKEEESGGDGSSIAGSETLLKSNWSLSESGHQLSPEGCRS